MYHRFNEDKYPSTNIDMKIFKKQIELIKKEKIDFIDPKNFGINFNLKKPKKKFYSQLMMLLVHSMSMRGLI